MTYYKEKYDNKIAIKNIIRKYPGIGFEGIVDQASKLPESKAITRPTVYKAIKRLLDDKTIIKIEAKKVENSHREIINDIHEKITGNKTRIRYFLSKKEMERKEVRSEIIYDFLSIYTNGLREPFFTSSFKDIYRKTRWEILEKVENNILDCEIYGDEKNGRKR